VKDRLDVSWQIVPRQLIRLIGDADRARATRAFDATGDDAGAAKLLSVRRRAISTKL
jgi:predicted 3-demethylubiquinone-9 3-methyltransferase (glyoxalase superfamily)